jgi:hypothetical protein
MSIGVGAYETPPPDDGRSFETGRVNLGTIQVTLIRIEANFAALRTDIHYLREAQMTRTAENERRFNDQEARLRVLESKRFIESKSVMGIVGIILPICAIAVAIVSIIVK